MVSDNTKSVYRQKIKTLVSDHKLKLSDFLNNPKKVDGIIKGKYSNINTQRTYLQAVLYFIRNSGKSSPQNENEYSTIITDLSNQMLNEMEHNRLSKREETNYLSWDEVLEAKDKLRDMNGVMATKAYILLSLYTELPPRRVQDYLYMKYVTEYRDDIDKSYNYFVEKRPIINLVFNYYKTSQKMGPIIVEVDMPDEFFNKFDEYKENKDIKHGDILFGFKNQPELSAFIKRVFKKVTGKATGINLLRHAYISDTINENMSVAERKEMATLMGHSVPVQMLYKKIE
jgi:hypothetical protein